MSEISEQLLRQRTRNNIIDYLEIASSAEAQRKYERDLAKPGAPGIVPSEMIEMWNDLVHAEEFDWYSEPVFSTDETTAMKAFHQIWNKAADDTPDPMPHTVESLIGTEPWDRLIKAAQNALNVFMQRGRFSSDVEE